MMSQSWFVKHNDKTVGPITSGRLKQLVRDAKIKPATEVRLGEAGRWIQAIQVKGLIQTQQTRPQTQPASQQAGSTELMATQTKHVDITKPTQPKSFNPYQTPTIPREATSPSHNLMRSTGSNRLIRMRS